MDYKKELEDLVLMVQNDNVSDLHFSEGRVPIVRSSGFLIPVLKKKPLTKNQQALYNLMQEYADKGVDVSYIDIPKTITQKFLKETMQFFTGFIKTMLILFPPKMYHKDFIHTNNKKTNKREQKASV
jgi:hypothetical protein